MEQTPVLIVGAGPTGLVLALILARRGIHVRIIDDDETTGAYSRAMVVHARTLEFHRQLGFAEDVLAAGIKVESARVREARRNGSAEKFHLQCGEIGRGLSPYPFVLAYPQDDHERFLVTRLHQAGPRLNGPKRLTGFSQNDRGVRAIIASSDGQAEDVTAEYLCGCDGAHSVVRETLAVGFPGGTYDQVFYVADVRIAGDCRTDLSAGLSETILSLMLPVRSSGMQRFIGLVPPEVSNRSDPSFEDVRLHLEPLFGVRVVDVNWFATYCVHHRIRTFVEGLATFVEAQRWESAHRLRRSTSEPIAASLGSSSNAG